MAVDKFGIGEWYGKVFTELSPQEKRQLNDARKKQQPIQCPFKPEIWDEANSRHLKQRCNKAGGVCSLQKYQNTERGVVPVSGREGDLRITCPSRFLEDRLVQAWIGEKLLDTSEPHVVQEVGFLRAVFGGSQNSPDAKSTESGTEGPVQIEDENDIKLDEAEKAVSGKDVGRIDLILVRPNSSPLSWCAVEHQAVYFSGSGMSEEFEAAAANPNPGAHWPEKIRRPDYRSSGPKRLMPQLQIKVPALRRWGKKMAVVVDDSFIQNMGSMIEVPEEDVSNCDILWFVVRLVIRDGKATLRRGHILYTTLENSVEGLTAGIPVSLETFDDRIAVAIARHPAKLKERIRILRSQSLNKVPLEPFEVPTDQ